MCKDIRRDLPLDAPDPSKQVVGAALTAFAEAGLLDLDFLTLATPTVGAADMQRAASVIEVLAAHSGSLASIYLVNAVMAGACVARAGTPTQQSEFLPQLRGGALQVAFAMTEPEAGSDAAGIMTAAIPDGESGFRLTGEKLYATGAATADRIIVVARTGGQGDKRSFGLFMVRGGTPGLTVEPLADKLAAGVHASCRVRLDNVPVGPEAALSGPGQLGKAWDTLRYMGTLERLAVSALALGLASAIVERAVTYARDRRQFGQPIASFQAIQHMLVEMKTTETGMRLFVEHALATFERAGDRTEDATQAVCMAKWVCAEQLQRVSAQGMRVMGGRAYFGGLDDMARFYLEAPFSLYAGGTIEIQKMLIARTMGLV
jgi:alkylation response protein AidB-like acyl-CoA dehydrogenase